MVLGRVPADTADKYSHSRGLRAEVRTALREHGCKAMSRLQRDCHGTRPSKQASVVVKCIVGARGPQKSEEGALRDAEEPIATAEEAVLIADRVDELRAGEESGLCGVKEAVNQHSDVEMVCDGG